MLGKQERRLAARRFHKATVEVERGKGGLHLLLEIGAELLGPAGTLALGLEADAAVEVLKELARGDLAMGVGDGVFSCHGVSFWRPFASRKIFRVRSAYRVTGAAGRAVAHRICLAKASENGPISPQTTGGKAA